MSEEKQPETKMGRPKKRDASLVAISEAMGLRLSADILSIEDMEGFPQIHEESQRNQGIMAMWAAGFPQSHIAEAFDVTQPTISEIINRIDPNGMFKLSPKRKKAMITQLAEGRAMSAINSIGLNDLMELDADKRANVAQKMMKISQDLNVSKHKNMDRNNMQMLMDEMARESVDAEFTVEEETNEDG